MRGVGLRQSRTDWSGRISRPGGYIRAAIDLITAAGFGMPRSSAKRGKRAGRVVSLPPPLRPRRSLYAAPRSAQIALLDVILPSRRRRTHRTQPRRDLPASPRAAAPTGQHPRKDSRTAGEDGASDRRLVPHRVVRRRSPLRYPRRTRIHRSTTTFTFATPPMDAPSLTRHSSRTTSSMRVVLQNSKRCLFSMRRPSS